MGEEPRVTAGDRVRRGRPRSDRVHRAILDATRDLIVDGGFGSLRLEHVAARAGVGKAAIYRRWRSKEALALELLLELAAPHLAVADQGDTVAELRAVVTNSITALTATAFGPVMRELLSAIAGNPGLGDPFRASVVRRRRDEVAAALARAVARGDLPAGALDAADVATELLVGPVYFRLMFGGPLDEAFADRLVEVVVAGLGRR